MLVEGAAWQDPAGPAYRRPDVEIATFTNARGEEIPYGHRYWVDDADPPDNAYSACLHPERFAPVQQVADALLDHLEATYDVVRTDAQEPRRRVVTLRPARGGGTPLVVATSTEGTPHVEVSAGGRFLESWPDCGCDACDDDVVDLLDDLEDTVLTIAEGGMSEWRSEGESRVGALRRAAAFTRGVRGPAVPDRLPWEAHVRFDGRREDEQSGWSAEEPEPVDLPLEARRWDAWPLRP